MINIMIGYPYYNNMTCLWFSLYSCIVVCYYLCNNYVYAISYVLVMYYVCISCVFIISYQSFSMCISYTCLIYHVCVS